MTMANSFDRAKEYADSVMDSTEVKHWLSTCKPADAVVARLLIRTAYYQGYREGVSDALGIERKDES